MTTRDPGADGLEAFFDRAETSFAEAAARAGESLVHELQVAGHQARLRFAGRALEQAVMPTLRHLEAPAPRPLLTVLIWDARSTGVNLTPPFWETVTYYERANLRGFQDGRFTLVYNRRARVFSAVDNARGRAIYWLHGVGAVPYFERAAPLRHVFQGWLQREGLFVAHASAVGLASGGVMVSGRSGCGKSTTAIACLAAGLGYLGDDYILLSANGQPFAYSLYACAKLNRDTLAWFPDLSDEVVNRDVLDVEKALIVLGGSRGPSLLGGFPLRAILLPQLHDARETRLRRVTPGSAFRALAPDTLFTSLGNPRLTSRGLHRLVHALPCYEVALGRDLAHIPSVIAELCHLNELVGERHG